MSGTNQPSFKVDLNRNKTKKWVEAPTYDYGGDDWEVADEYGEYDGPAEAPAPVPQAQTGFRQHGQTASVSSNRGTAQPTSSKAPAAPPPLQRVNSYEAGDEHQTFSAVTSPAVAQGETVEQFPRQSVEQRATTGHMQPDQSHEDFYSAPQSVRHSSDIQPAPSHYPQHTPRFDVQHPEPSHEPEYDERDYSTNPNQAGLGLSGQKDDHNPRHSYLPPLRSEIEAGAYHYPLANQSRSLPFPPRKSSLSSSSRPDLRELYQASGRPMDAGYGSPQFSNTSAGNQAGSARDRYSEPEAEEEDDQVEQSNPAPRFIRPADIYKRMAEEKEKERQSMDSTRHSPERAQSAAVSYEARSQPFIQSSFGSSAQQHSPGQQSTAVHSESPLPPVEPAQAQQPAVQQVASSVPPPVSNDHPQSELSSPRTASSLPHTGPAHLPGLSISNPILARALGAGVQEDDSAQHDAQSTNRSPTLPSITRFSGFGSLSDGIWQNQTAISLELEPTRDANTVITEPHKGPAALRDTFDPVTHPSSSSAPQSDTERSDFGIDHPVPQTVLAHERNISEEGPLSSPTAYYFSQHTGSLDDRLYDSTQDDEPYRIQHETEHVADDHELARKPYAGDDTEALNHNGSFEREVTIPEPLPDASQAISREELEINRPETCKGTLGDSGSFEHEAANNTADQAYERDTYVQDEVRNSSSNSVAHQDNATETGAGACDEDAPYSYDVAAPSTQHDNPEADRRLKDTTAQTLLDLENDGGEHLGTTHTDDGLRGVREAPQVPEEDILDQSSMAVRESDLASAVNAQEDYHHSDIGEAEQEARSNFLRQPPDDARNRLLPQPLQVDPLMRSPSPGGRVKQLADRYDEIHSLSRQNTMQQSPTSSSPVHQGYDTSSKQNSLRGSEYERPHLPGEWVSYADTVASGSRDYDDEREFNQAETPSQEYEDESAATPKAEEGPIDFSPNTNKRHLYGASAEGSSNPMAVLAEAGHALANSLKSVVGLQNDDDDDTDSDATESLLPSGAPTPDVNGQRFSGFQAQPSPLARADPAVSFEKDIETHSQEPIGENDVIRRDEPRTVDREAPDESVEDASDAEEEVPPPAPLRPHSHLGRPQPSVNTTPQRPIWPSQTSQMSINYSPDDTENDRLRKEIVQSLSPRPDANRVSMDASSNPRSSTEYPQFSAIQDSTPERKAASTPLHLSPPTTMPLARELSPERSSGVLKPKPSLLSVQTSQPANMSRESTLLPREYDSYWAERDEQSGNEVASNSLATISQQGLGIQNMHGEQGSNKSAKEPESAVTEPSSAYSERPNYANTDMSTRQPDSAITEPSSAYSPRPDYLKKRFSWENNEADDAPDTSDSFIRATQDIGDTAKAIHGATGLTDVSASNVVPAPPDDVRDLSSSAAATPVVPQGPIQSTVPIEPSSDIIGRHSAESSTARGSTEREHDTAIPAIDLPNDDLPTTSPATYKYDRPFQRAQDATDTERDKATGLRQVSSLGRPMQATRTISSGHFSARGASVSGTETSLPGFKTIAAMRDTPDRIATFEKTREGFAKMDTGLNDWLSFMVRTNPELSNGVDAPTHRTTGGGFAGSMRHKLTPSIAKLTKPVTGSPTSPSTHAPSASIAEESSPIAATRSASSAQRRTPSTSDTSKGKMFLQSAGQGAKGLFAKGRHKLRGASGEKVEHQPRQRFSYHKPLPVSGVPRTPAKHNDESAQDESARKSPTPIWQAFAKIRDDVPPPLPSEHSQAQRDFDAHTTTASTRQTSDMLSPSPTDGTARATVLTVPISAGPSNRVTLHERSEAFKRQEVERLAEHSDPRHYRATTQDAPPQAPSVPIRQLRKDSFTAQTNSDVSLPLQQSTNIPERPVSPLYTHTTRSPLHVPLDDHSTDSSVSSIAHGSGVDKDTTNNSEPVDADQIVSPIQSSLDSHNIPTLQDPGRAPADQPDTAEDAITRAPDEHVQNDDEQPAQPALRQQPGRLSLALEKQQSAVVTETEIHPALLSRAGSTFGALDSEDTMLTSRAGNAAGALANSPSQGAASSQNRAGKGGRSSIIHNSTSEQRRQTRSKSPFSRWRARSRSRDALQAFGRHDVIDALADSDMRVAAESHPVETASPAASASSKRRQSPFARFRQRSRGRSLGGVEAEQVVASQNNNADLARVPTANTTGRGRSHSRNRLRKKSLTTTNTDTIPRLPQEKDHAKRKEKRRSWYNQFVCYDDENGRRPSASLPAPEPSAVGPPGSTRPRSRSRAAQDHTALPVVADTDGRSTPRETRENAEPDPVIPSRSQHAQHQSMDHAYESRRASGIYDPYATFESSDVAQDYGRGIRANSLLSRRAAQERPWATPNHYRHSTSFLEHKDWRKQHSQPSASSSGHPSTQPQKVRRRAISPFSRGQVPLEREPHSPIPGLPSHLQHLELALSPPRSAASTPMSSADAGSSHRVASGANGTAHRIMQAINRPSGADPSTTNSSTVRQQRTSSTASQHTRARAPSLTTSINVNVGNNDMYNNNNQVPALPVLPREAAYMQAMGAQFAPNDLSIDVARWRAGVASASSHDNAIATDSSAAASAGIRADQGSSKRAEPRAADNAGWPLRNDTPLDHGSDGHKGRPTSGNERAASKDEEDEDYVVMSPTLDGPGWEWRPDISQMEDGAVRA